MAANPILEVWSELAVRQAGRPAVISPEGEVLRTFFDIEAEAASLRDAMLGTGTVSLQLGNSAAWPSVLIAAWHAERTVLLADNDLAGSRREEAERLCGVSLRVEEEGKQLRLVRLEKSSVDWRTKPDLIKLTSGTSGSPRGVRFSAAQLLADCTNVCETMGIGPGDLNYGVISFAHSYGFSNLITPLLCRGLPLVAADDVLAMARGLRSSGATVLPAVPAMYRLLLSEPTLPDSLRLCISAGAPLPATTALAFREKFGRKIHSFYGASECGGICYDNSSGQVPQGFVGQPMRGVSLEAEETQTGLRIGVKSDAVGSGYHLEEKKDFCGEFSPPDFLARDGDGYRIVGRALDFLNVSGKKVSPATIEAAILQISGVHEAVVFGVCSENRGDEIHACVAGEAIDEAAVKSGCASQLPGWQVPRFVHVMKEIPVTSRGKINREELAERFGK